MNLPQMDLFQPMEPDPEAVQEVIQELIQFQLSLDHQEDYLQNDSQTQYESDISYSE